MFHKNHLLDPEFAKSMPIFAAYGQEIANWSGLTGSWMKQEVTKCYRGNLEYLKWYFSFREY